MVVEVVLGGTWDCTNVVQGDVAVLTNVSFDHTDVLGPTLEGSRRTRRASLSPGAGWWWAKCPQSCPTSSRAVRRRGVGAASVWVAGRDFGCESNRVAVGGRVVTLWTPGGRYEDVLLPLHGAHQGRNASVALGTVEAFFGGPLDAEVAEEGLAAVRVPGRLEVLGRRPLLLVDGAHNAAGMAALARRWPRSSQSTACPSLWWGCCRAVTLRPCSLRWHRSAWPPSSPASRIHHPRHAGTRSPRRAAHSD